MFGTVAFNRFLKGLMKQHKKSLQVNVVRKIGITSAGQGLIALHNI